VAQLVLLALGLAIIFGMIGVLNLAQEEFLTLGAYTVLYLRPCDPGHRALGWHSRQ
jgi:branched-subunit amino acid ABC-type transport system permease component